MQKIHYAVVLSTLLLGACGRNEAPTTTTPTATPPATATVTAPAPAPAVAKPAVASAEDIAAIEATGKTGLWADVPEMCAKDVKTGVVSMVSWNVKTETDGRVILSIIDATGRERDFGQGGPVGHRQTGPWLRPGLKFRLRTKDGDRQIAEMAIAEKQC